VLSTPRGDIHYVRTSHVSLSSVSHSGYTTRCLLAGSAKIRIGDGEFDIGSGQAALINPAEVYALRSESPQTDMLTVVLHPLTIADIATKLNLSRVGQEFKFRQTIVSDARLVELFRELLGELREKKIGHEMVIDSLIDHLAIHLLRHHFSVRRNLHIEFSRYGFVDRRVRRAIEFIHTHFDQELSVEQIARAAFLSEFHFARLFKQLLGATPHAYLASVRVEQAMKLLTTTDLSLLEISQRIGYASQSHFTKVFKNLTGFTPREFRQAAVR